MNRREALLTTMAATLIKPINPTYRGENSSVADIYDEAWLLEIEAIAAA